jgi:hypothetical protein
MPPRLNRMTATELDALILRYEQISADFDAMMNEVNGRVPARTIDKWLKVHRQLDHLRLHMCALAATGSSLAV